jgi:hypothetical protein
MDIKLLLNQTSVILIYTPIHPSIKYCSISLKIFIDTSFSITESYRNSISLNCWNLNDDVTIIWYLHLNEKRTLLMWFVTLISKLQIHMDTLFTLQQLIQPTWWYVSTIFEKYARTQINTADWIIKSYVMAHKLLLWHKGSGSAMLNLYISYLVLNYKGPNSKHLTAKYPIQYWNCSLET